MLGVKTGYSSFESYVKRFDKLNLIPDDTTLSKETDFNKPLHNYFIYGSHNSELPKEQNSNPDMSIINSYFLNDVYGGCIELDIDIRGKISHMTIESLDFDMVLTGLFENYVKVKSESEKVSFLPPLIINIDTTQRLDMIKCLLNYILNPIYKKIIKFKTDSKYKDLVINSFKSLLMETDDGSKIISKLSDLSGKILFRINYNTSLEESSQAGGYKKKIIYKKKNQKSIKKNKVKTYKNKSIKKKKVSTYKKKNSKSIKNITNIKIKTSKNKSILKGGEPNVNKCLSLSDLIEQYRKQITSQPSNNTNIDTTIQLQLLEDLEESLKPSEEILPVNINKSRVSTTIKSDIKIDESANKIKESESKIVRVFPSHGDRNYDFSEFMLKGIQMPCLNFQNYDEHNLVYQLFFYRSHYIKKPEDVINNDNAMKNKKITSLTKTDETNQIKPYSIYNYFDINKERTSANKSFNYFYGNGYEIFNIIVVKTDTHIGVFKYIEGIYEYTIFLFPLKKDGNLIKYLTEETIKYLETNKLTCKLNTTSSTNI